MNKNRKQKKEKSSWKIAYDKMYVRSIIESEKVCWYTREPLDEATTVIVEVFKKKNDLFTITVIGPNALKHIQTIKEEADQKGYTVKLTVSNPNVKLPSLA